MVCLRVKASILFSVWEKILRTLTVVKPLFRWTGFLATSRFERRTTGTTKRHKFHSWRRRDKRWGMDEQKIQQGTRSFPTWKGKMSRSVQYVFFSSCHTHYIPSNVMLKCPTRKSVVGPAASSAPLLFSQTFLTFLCPLISPVLRGRRYGVHVDLHLDAEKKLFFASTGVGL